MEQTQGDRLLSGAANVFAWFPDATATEGRWWGTLSCAVAVALIGLAYWRGEDTAERRILLAISTVAACPLLLPQMHDRYFFTAEVISLLLLRASDLRFLPWLLSGTGLTAYLLYFVGNQYALPLMIASVVQAFGVSLLLRGLVKSTDPWQCRLVNVSP